MSPSPSTPCIRVCILDDELGICLGCGRTPDEIARWGRLTESERLSIMATLDERLSLADAATRDEGR